MQQLTLALVSSGTDEDRSNRVEEAFASDTKLLLTELAKHVLRSGIPREKDLNLAIAYFVKDLFSVVDRGFALDLVKQSYIGWISKSHSELL